MARPRPCLGIPDNRCPALTTHTTGRCDDCRRTVDRGRGTTAERGYDQDHKDLRAALAPAVATGRIACARCGQPIQRGEPWDLGHADDRTTYRGPEHSDCNRGKRPRAPQPSDRPESPTIPTPPQPTVLDTI